jgi:hypothetical protein
VPARFSLPVIEATLVARRRAAVALAIALGVAGCGGGPRARSISSARAATPEEIRELLARYSPSSHAVLAAYEALPTRFELPEGPYEVASSDTFDGYLRDGAIESLVTYTTTAVHEITHGYIGRMGFQLLAERDLSFADGAQAIPIAGEPWLVRFTIRFPSVEMDETFPADARTSRYATYITPGEPRLGTQAEGVYGLLDELAASYQDARATVDFWPWVRDEARADARLIMNYAVLLDDLQRAHAELTLYVLHYLRHAHAHRPGVHAAVMGNDAFRRAFVAVHDGFAALVASVQALEPEVHAFARTRGVALARRDGQLLIDGHPQRPDEAAAIRAVRAHLEGEAYRSELAALRGP